MISQGRDQSLGGKNSTQVVKTQCPAQILPQGTTEGSFLPMLEPFGETPLSRGVLKCCFSTGVPGGWKHHAALVLGEEGLSPILLLFVIRAGAGWGSPASSTRPRAEQLGLGD